MANLNQMKAAAAAQGASAPPDYPGGPDAWVADWYQNAVNAGSIQDASTPRTKGEATATDATTGSTPQGYKNTGTSSFADMIRAKAKAEGWSEDFERYSDAQIEAWKPSWDEQAGRFRSEGGGGALVEKPTECPEGTTLHGSKCVSWESLPYELGGGGGRGGGGAVAGAGGGAPAPTGRDRLQQALVDQYQGREGMFVGTPQGGQELTSGGIFWGQQAAGAAPAPASPVAAAISSGSGATPLSAGVTPAPSAANPKPEPAPTPAASFSTFNPNANLASATSELMQKSAGATQAPASATAALQASLQKKYPNPDQWWQKDAQSPFAI